MSKRNARTITYLLLCNVKLHCQFSGGIWECASSFDNDVCVCIASIWCGSTPFKCIYFNAVFPKCNQIEQSIECLVGRPTELNIVYLFLYKKAFENNATTPTTTTTALHHEEKRISSISSLAHSRTQWEYLTTYEHKALMMRNWTALLNVCVYPSLHFVIDSNAHHSTFVHRPT